MQIFEKYKLLVYSFIISFISLFGEMHLTRLLGYKSWNHVIYIIISLALLGYGIGSNISIFRKNNSVNLVPWLIAGQSILFVIAVFGIGRLPVFHMEWSQAISLITAYLITLLPFIVAGYALTLIFINIDKEQFGTAYFADLLGAGVGIALFFPTIKWLGVYRSIELFALISIVFVGVVYIKKYRYVLAPVALGIIALLSLSEKDLNIPIEPKKELGMAHVMQQRRLGFYNISYSGWYPLGKVEVVEPSDKQSARTYMDVVGYGTFMSPVYPLPPFQYFTNNAGAGTPAYNLSEEGIKKYNSSIYLFSTPMELPFLINNKSARVLIIGTGGGRDIYSSLLHGASEVVGAEINPITYKLMKYGFLSEYTGGIYNKENVHVYNEDGRTLVKKEFRKKSSYDTIIFNGVDTFTAVSTGAYTFAETYIYTQEAMDEYVGLLSENGVLNLNRWHFSDYPKETLRLFIMASYALKKNGATEPQKNLLYATFTAPYTVGGVGMLLVKKTPFTLNEQNKIIDFLLNRNFDRVEKVDILYKPYHNENLENPFVEYARASLKGERAEKEFIDNAPYDIAPVTDNNPFYFKYYRFADILKQMTVWNLDATPWGGYYAVFVQLIVLAVSFIMVLLFIVLPVFTSHRQWIKPVSTTMMTIYFSSIGLAYIFIEITLMQKTSVLFGSPIYPLGIIMGSMLVSTGIGSYFTKRISMEKIGNKLFHVTLVLAALLLLIIFYGDKLIELIFTLPFAVNAILVSIVSGLIGFILGFYFPAGIALWRRQNTICIPWSYAINAGSTVVSTMLSVMIAQIYGFNFVLALSLVLYLTAFSVFTMTYKKEIA